MKYCYKNLVLAVFFVRVTGKFPAFVRQSACIVEKFRTKVLLGNLRLFYSFAKFISEKVSRGTHFLTDHKNHRSTY